MFEPILDTTVSRVGGILLGVLDLAGKAFAIEFVEHRRHVGEDCQPLEADLREAAGHNHAALLATDVHHDDARLEGGHIGRMTGEHAEIAFGARDINLIDFAGKHEMIRRDEIEVEGGHAYAASAASFLPFSTASSMVPTM